MTTLAFPSNVGIAQVSYALLTNTQTHVSPLSGVTQTHELPGAHWSAAITLPPMTRSDALTWRAWFAKLMGPAGRFRLGDPSACTQCGYWGTPVPGTDCDSGLYPSASLYPAATLTPAGDGCIPEVSLSPSASITLQAAAVRGATSVQIEPQTGWDYATYGVNPNWESGDQVLLCAGEMVQIGEQLVMLTADLKPAGCSGGQLIQFNPPLHKAYAAGTAVEVDSPVGIFRLIDDVQVRWDVGEAAIHGIRFSAIEVIA